MPAFRAEAGIRSLPVCLTILAGLHARVDADTPGSSAMNRDWADVPEAGARFGPWPYCFAQVMVAGVESMLPLQVIVFP